MKRVLIGIAAVTLGAFALLQIGGTATGAAIRIAQAAAPADQAAPSAGQAAPPAPALGAPTRFDDPEDPDGPGDFDRPGAPDDGEDAN
jgi:hypothetical protein